MDDNIRQPVFDAVRQYYQSLTRDQKASSYIPVSGKLLDEDDLLVMIDASLDMWLTAGRYNEQFEQSLAHYLSIPYTLSTNSGSSANLLAFSALTSHTLGERKIQAGDEIITVASAFPTTINPILQHGCIPVFVDCECLTYNIDVTRIERAISSKTKAIVLAHTLGNPFELEAIQALCQQYNLWLIEDSCDALGAEYKSKKLGTIGDIGTYSFYPAHHITMGEGGAVVTRNRTLYKILLSLRDWGRDCWCAPGTDNTCKNRFSLQRGTLPHGYDHKYTYSHIGYNLKITDWQAALGCSQLKKLPSFLEKRKANAHFLLKALSDCTEYLILPQEHAHTSPSWFGFLLSVQRDAPFIKSNLVQYLEQSNIGTRELFAGNILRQPMMTAQSLPLRIEDSELKYSHTLTEADYNLLPNTEYIMNSTFWIGIHPALTQANLITISDTIHRFIEQSICKQS